MLIVVALAYMSAFSQTCDSVRGQEGVDYSPGQVIVIIDKGELCLNEFLNGLSKKDTVLKQENSLLYPLGIRYSLLGFMTGPNLVLVKTKAGQTVREAIADIWQSANVKLRSVCPNYYSRAESARF